MRLLLPLLITTFVISCAPRADVTAYRQLSPVSPSSVEVFTDRRPGRDFEEIGLIEVNQGNGWQGYGDLVAKAQEEAALLGANAILVSRRPIEGAVGFAIPGDIPTVAAQEDDAPRIWVVPIVWRE